MTEDTAHPKSGGRIAFQGEAGAYSHLASREMMPNASPVPCATFEDMYASVADGRADYAMVPIENSLAGRVADKPPPNIVLGVFGVWLYFQSCFPITFSSRITSLVKRN